MGEDRVDEGAGDGWAQGKGERAARRLVPGGHGRGQGKGAGGMMQRSSFDVDHGSVIHAAARIDLRRWLLS